MKRARDDAGQGSAGVSVLSAQAGAGLDLCDGEEVTLVVDKTVLFLTSHELGQGSVYVTTQRLAWLSDDGSGGYAVGYPDITLHAVCRDPDAYLRPCIFAQLAAAAPESDGEDETTEEEAVPAATSSSVADERSARAAAARRLRPETVDELRLQPMDGARVVAPAAAAGDASSAAATPDVAGLLERLFEAISRSQELHPDEEMMAVGGGGDDDEYGEGGEGGGMMMSGAGGWFVSSASGEGGSSSGPVFSGEQMAQMERLEGMFASAAAEAAPLGAGEGEGEGEGEEAAQAAPPGQFDDAT